MVLHTKFLGNNAKITVDSYDSLPLEKEMTFHDIHKDIFACLFSIHNIISLSCHEQVCLSGLRFERFFSHHRAR